MCRTVPIAFVFAGLVGCGGEPATFTRVQSEVLTVSCASFASCHRGGSPAGGLTLEPPAYALLVDRPSTEAPDRVLVKPGQPEASFLMDKLLDRNLPASNVAGVTWTAMPPGGVLLEAERIELVSEWITMGAKND